MKYIKLLFDIVEIVNYRFKDVYRYVSSTIVVR